MPASGVKAKGISEKGILEKNAAAEKAVVIEKPAEKLAPVETTASLPAESRRPAQPPREKTAAKPAPGPVQPVVAAAPAEPAATAGEERRDANDLARAAIERLRGSDTPRAPETARVQEPCARTTTAAAAGVWHCEAAAAADHCRRATGESTGRAAALCRARTRRRSRPSDAACRNPHRAAAA